MAATTETRAGLCATHGTVQAEPQLPKLTFPFLLTAVMRSFAKRKPVPLPGVLPVT